MRGTLIALLLLLPMQLCAQRPVVDPKIQNEMNDDVREIKTRGETVRMAALEESLRLPTRQEREARHLIWVQDFSQEGAHFESSIAILSIFRPNGTYSKQTLRQGNSLEPYTQSAPGFGVPESH